MTEDDIPWTGGMTQAEIGEVMGISKARVGQIEKKALRKLKRRLEKLAREYGVLPEEDHERLPQSQG